MDHMLVLTTLSIIFVNYSFWILFLKLTLIIAERYNRICFQIFQKYFGEHERNQRDKKLKVKCFMCLP